MRNKMFIKFFKISLTLLCVCFYSFGQVKPTRSQVFKLIKSSILTKREAKIMEPLYWTTCNQDSAFFKADTIRLYNGINYFYQISSCCNFIEMAFYKKDAFYLRKSQICKEPSTADAHIDYYQLKITKHLGELYFAINKSKSGVSKFVIVKIESVKLEERPPVDVIVLKRLKQTISSP